MRYYMILKLTTLNLFYFILFHSITSTLFVKRTRPIWHSHHDPISFSNLKKLMPNSSGKPPTWSPS